MGLIDRLIEPMKDYISFRDFIFRLSSINNEPLYEVVTYLLHHDLDAVAFYNIDTDYKIIRFSPYEFDTVAEFLKEIQKALSFSSEEWVWSHPTSLSELRDQDRRALTNTVSKAMYCFFKKSELLSFQPLNGLLHFDTTDKNTSKINVPTPINIEIGEYQRLLLTYKLFTPAQLVCLLIDENPACISHNDKFHAHWDMVSTALDANELTPINEKEQIKAEQVKAWLAKCGFIYKGFNDSLIKDTDKINQSSQQLTDVQENIVQPTINSDSAEAINRVTDIGRVYLPKHPKENTLHTDLGKHQKLLITYDVFTRNQIICLILNYPPGSSSIDHEFVSYLHWIDEEVRSGDLVISNEEDDVDARNIDAQQVKVWLARNNYIYEGFNDNIPADPVAQVRQLTAQIAQLTAENNNLKEKLSKANTALADAPVDDSTLQTILDESHENHAPDLKHAVQLWIDLYIHKRVGGNSHTGRADNWIGKHTSYDAEITKADKNSINRIREVATPLKHFGSKRSRENKK